MNESACDHGRDNGAAAVNKYTCREIISNSGLGENLRHYQVQVIDPVLLQQRLAQLHVFLLVQVAENADDRAVFLLHAAVDYAQVPELFQAVLAPGGPEVEHRDVVFGEEVLTAHGIAVQVRRLKLQHLADPGVLRLCRNRELGFRACLFDGFHDLPVFLDIFGLQVFYPGFFIFKTVIDVPVRLADFRDRCKGGAQFCRILHKRFYFALVLAAKETGQEGILAV